MFSPFYSIVEASSKDIEERVPHLRFSGFNKGWKKKKLSDIVDRVTRRNKENNQNILTISAQFGLVSQNKFFSKIVAAQDVMNYYLLHRDDYAYNKSYSKGYPMGAVKRLVDDEKGVVSTLYICFNAKESSSVGFLDQYFESGRHNPEIEKIAQEGARNHGLLNMSVGDFFGTELWIPSINEEQEKIAGILGSLDKIISLQTKKLEALNRYKKGIMQKVFSREIRFAGFEGEWERKRIQDLFSKVTERSRSGQSDSVLTNSAVYGVMKQTDFFDKEIAVQGNLSNYFIVRTDDFVYNPRISETAPVGPFNRNHLGQGVMSPLYSVFRSKGSVNLDFIEQYLKTECWHKYMKDVANYGARHDRMAVTTNDLLSLPIPKPSIAEQNMIAGFLRSLDGKIATETNRLDRANSLKKSLLQQLFI